MKIIKSIFVLLLIALVVLQFFRPQKNHGGYESIAFFETETKPSDEVAGILKNNCYDCHSNQTNYPWYAEVAPVSYWLDEHIKHGKSHFNVSTWQNYSVKKKDHKLEELVEMVKEGTMPLDSYTWVHGDLSDAQRKLVLQWAQRARLPYEKALKVSGK